MPNEFKTMINHELRHEYLRRILGPEVYDSSYPLKEGTAGLSADSTARLISNLEQGESKLDLPLSITHWDKKLGKIKPDKRCFIDNPWYLSMFSFFILSIIRFHPII